MFKVFSGSWRGLGKTEEVRFMQIGFEFRSLLKHFKGAALSVFMCIVLHSDQDGKAHPGYEVIQAETGLSRDSVSTALGYLAKLVIEDQRVLLRYRIRNKKTKAFIGSNHYIVFPTPEQVLQYKDEIEWFDPDLPSQSPFFPTSAKQTGDEPQEPEPESDFSDVGKSDLKNNQRDKKKEHGEPEAKPADNSLGADAPARAFPSSGEKLVLDFPEDCREGAGLMWEVFKIKPPKRPAPDARGGNFALWINGIRDLIEISKEYDVPLSRAMRLTFESWNSAPFRVSHPAALRKTMVSALAQASSQKSNRDSNFESPLDNFIPRGTK